MLKFCILLISALFVTQCTAQELNTTFSGFIDGTTFSNRNFYPNKSELAVNTDVSYGEYAFRAQISAPYNQVVRRAVIEKSFELNADNDVTIQLGKFIRLTTFYNNVTDSPATAGVAMLPLGLYDRRMVDNETFTAINGINVVVKSKVGNGVLLTRFDYGLTHIEDACHVQLEINGPPCTDDYRQVGEKGNYDYSLNYETDSFGFILARSIWRGGVTLENPNSQNVFTGGAVPPNVLNPIAIQIIDNESHVKYISTSFGISYSKNGYSLETELRHDSYYEAGLTGPFKNVSSYNTFYFLAGYNWTDEIYTYISESTGNGNTTGSEKDTVLGVTYDYSRWTFSLEEHRGHGLQWENYNANNASWTTTVFATTYRF
jgi:hypothetical protein